MLPSEYIQEHGWKQGGDGGYDGRPSCAMDAISYYIALDDNDLWIRYRSALMLSVGDSDIPKWNDTPGRTEVEVIAALQETERALGLVGEVVDVV